MAKISGTVQRVQTNQEDKNVVLRFKIRSDAGELIPVEMRGRRVCGLLEAGDQVIMNCGRDRYGVMHPRVITNLTTRSSVRTRSPGFFSTVIKFLFSIGFSIATGVLTHLIISSFTKSSKSPVSEYSMPRSGNLANSGMEPVGLILAVAVALLVFYLIFIRPRRR